MSEKLQKVLARAGLGSRREMETWIEAGRVSVNGEKVGVGERVVDTDVIRVDGKVIPKQKTVAGKRRVIVYHKPLGEVSTRKDPEGRKTVFEHLPPMANGRWIVIGRLDINTLGLLIFTNDGELANRLMHPSSEIDREYAVRVLGDVTAETINKLKSGVELDDGPAHFDTITDAGGEGANHWYHVTLKEGRNREVRRLWESQDVTVSRLIRVRFGPIWLPRNLRPGKWAELDEKLTEQLLLSVGMAPAEKKKPMRKAGNSKPKARKTRHGTAQSRRRRRGAN